MEKARGSSQILSYREWLEGLPLCRQYFLVAYGFVPIAIRSTSGIAERLFAWAVGFTRADEDEFLGVWDVSGDDGISCSNVQEELVRRGVERVRFSLFVDAENGEKSWAETGGPPSPFSKAHLRQPADRMLVGERVSLVSRSKWFAEAQGEAVARTALFERHQKSKCAAAEMERTEAVDKGQGLCDLSKAERQRVNAAEREFVLRHVRLMECAARYGPHSSATSARSFLASQIAGSRWPIELSSG